MKQLYDNISEMASCNVTKTYSTSFSIAVGLLHKSIRQDIHNIYGFVRVADEIVDSFHDYDQEHLFKSFSDEFWNAYATGISTNPIIHSFVQTLLKYKIDQHLVDAFLRSMKADLNRKDYDSKNDLDEYIYGSADVVGLMCLKVFVKGDLEKYEQLKSFAMRLGSAFQKVNFLRDLKDDLEILNRSYFHNIEFGSMSNEQKQEIIAEIEEDFKIAYNGIRQLPREARKGVYIAFRYYKKLFNKLKKTKAKEILQQRIRVSNFTKFVLLLDSDLRLRLNAY